LTVRVVDPAGEAGGDAPGYRPTLRSFGIDALDALRFSYKVRPETFQSMENPISAPVFITESQGRSVLLQASSSSLHSKSGESLLAQPDGRNEKRGFKRPFRMVVNASG
jgi:hypothetical protein